MRKVVVYELLSLDGVAENPDSYFDAWDDAADDNLAQVIATQDAVVLGRASYDEWAGYWPTSDIEPFATFINGVAKHVVTSKPLDRDWPNCSLVQGNVATYVQVLKHQPGGDIGVHASISVAQTLLTAGVVDELRLVIFPAVSAGGRRLLDGLPPSRLTLSRSSATPSGLLLADYRVAAPTS